MWRASSRASTSAGLYHGETGVELAGSEGAHVYIVACDGTELQPVSCGRRMSAAGWPGWAGTCSAPPGSLRPDRSIVGSYGGRTERLVFEGGPLLDPPVRQHCERRKPVATAGEALDTVAIRPPLTIAETGPAAGDQGQGGARAGG